MKVTVILPAAGLGTRMGKAVNGQAPAEKTGTSRKQFMLLDGSPILLHTVRKFAACARVGEIVVAVRKEEMGWVGELLHSEIRNKPVRVVEGGKRRQECVATAPATLAAAPAGVAVLGSFFFFVDRAPTEKGRDEA